MYVVTVKFYVKPENIDQFLPAMKKQADDSLSLEPACTHFDVCQSENDNNLVFLYEIYQSKADFDIHLNSPHFKAFSATVSDWVSNKEVEIFTLA